VAVGAERFVLRVTDPETIRLARGSFERPDDQVPEDVPPRLLEAIRAAINKGR